jgi:autotransporter strand-loop-strand O-heptosyltransferase
MFKNLRVCATFNERTGYGIHASRFFPELDKLVAKAENASGVATISLLDVVTASTVPTRHPSPSILFTVWESTEYPAALMERLSLYDQLWVPSQWQRDCGIAQGIPADFIKVVPEGVDPEVYKPEMIVDPKDPLDTKEFRFVHVGQWQPRKSTLEICQAFLKAFPLDALYPENWKVRLYISADTLFPSDNYASTEERLKAYGVEDSRIIPVHFEEREAYIRRLQSAHCFVSCSRSEGWGLPIIEAMACGIPTIVADFGGSTEYARGAINVPIVELKKPEGIYGGWDVPGKWGEPDYDVLAEKMRYVYANQKSAKDYALLLSEETRKNFSWQAAAQKAYDVLEELHAKVTGPQLTHSPVTITTNVPAVELSVESKIRLFAAQHGYQIPSLVKRNAIFALDCWPDNPEKMASLVETIGQVRATGHPVLVSSHYPLPEEVIKLADYYIYEKEDIMSGDDHPIYWRTKPDGTVEQKRANVEYQGVAAINCFRNAIDFCRGRFDWIYQMGADMEVDLPEWLSLVLASDKPMVCIPYEGRKDGIGGGLWAGTVPMLDRVIPRLRSWKEYADKYPDVRFVVERWLVRHLQDELKDAFDSCVEWISVDTTNRFDNVDRTLWDPVFECNFIEGGYFNIGDDPSKVYHVEWSSPELGVDFALEQPGNSWSRPDKKYFVPWTITASLGGEVKFTHTIDLTGKTVIISFGSKALGDTLAWIPYVEEFRKKHNCKVICSTWWNGILNYPNIEFVAPGTSVPNVYASYTLGCFDDQPNLNKNNWRVIPLQKVAADILGLDYEPIRAKLHVPGPRDPKKKPYICFSEFSTMQGKLWNRPGAWQNVIGYLTGCGLECVSVSSEMTQLRGVVKHNGQQINDTIVDIAGAEFYLGLNHGPAWVAHSLGIPVIMITGVSEPWNDPPNPYRIQTEDCRPGCFNDPTLPIDRGWEWCARKKDYICTKNITERMVIDMIEKVVRGPNCTKVQSKKKKKKGK